MSAYSKLIVISDLHLTQGEDPLLGIDTTARFAQAVAHVNRYHADADLMVVAGDIAEDESQGAYDHFLRIMSDLSLPWVATLGNHDNRTLFEATCKRNAETLRFDHAAALKYLSVFVLDTRNDGEADGSLTDAQLAWLKRQDFTEQNLIITHHPPQDLGIWTDCIKLRNEKPLFDILDTKAGQHAVLSGHVHMQSTGVWRGYPVTTMSGNYNTVTPILEATAQPDDELRTFCDGPAEYAVVVAHPDGLTIHSEIYDRTNTVLSAERVAELFARFDNH